MKQKVEPVDVNAAIEKGLRAIVGLIDDLTATPPEERESYHARALTDCVQALLGVQKERRAELEFLESRSLSPENMRSLIVSHLRELAPADFSALMAEAAPSVRTGAS